MRFLLYTHSLMSDWNHGNAHFLRGIMRELVARGHRALALEPINGWSRSNLVAEQGEEALSRFNIDFPELGVMPYDDSFEHEAALAEADVVIVHEWTEPDLVARIGKARRSSAFTLLFHDTHHRAVSDASAISGLCLEDYDAVLAFGATLREHYREAGWGRQVFTWHEAADTRLFKPGPRVPKTADLVWIGNWGDDESTLEISEYFVEPVKQLGLSATVHGVRYPPHAVRTLARVGIAYEGWLANADVPACFAKHRMTVHIPRRPYVERLPGIPTIRMFEALACAIPLVSAPWIDAESLFRPGVDFLFAGNGQEMRACLDAISNDEALARSLSTHGMETVCARHTCMHRVEELCEILALCGSEKVRKQLERDEAAQ